MLRSRCLYRYSHRHVLVRQLPGIVRPKKQGRLLEACFDALQILSLSVCCARLCAVCSLVREVRGALKGSCMVR